MLTHILLNNSIHFKKELFFYVLEDFLCSDAEVLLVLPEKQSVKRNGGLQNEKRILSICKRTKGKSQ